MGMLSQILEDTRKKRNADLAQKMQQLVPSLTAMYNMKVKDELAAQDRNEAVNATTTLAKSQGYGNEYKVPDDLKTGRDINNYYNTFIQTRKGIADINATGLTYDPAKPLFEQQAQAEVQVAKNKAVNQEITKNKEKYDKTESDAKALGSKYYAKWKSLVAKGADPEVALGDVKAMTKPAKGGGSAADKPDKQDQKDIDAITPKGRSGLMYFRRKDSSGKKRVVEIDVIRKGDTWYYAENENEKVPLKDVSWIAQGSDELKNNGTKLKGHVPKTSTDPRSKQTKPIKGKTYPQNDDLF